LLLIGCVAVGITAAADRPPAAGDKPAAAGRRRRREPAALRAPAVPLVTHDPYTSAWSFADRLTDDWPKHWTGKIHGMCGLVRVDGRVMRFLGAYPGVRDAAAQTAVRVLPTRSLYTFDCGGGVELAVTFMSPLVMDDLEMLARPASYVHVAARATDGAKHDVQVYLDLSGEWAVHDRSSR
jgi:hypothetical protein